MLSCSVWISAPSFWMGGGLKSRCIGRVCGADGAGHMAPSKYINKITLLHQVGIPNYFMRKMNGQRTLKFQCENSLYAMLLNPMPLFAHEGKLLPLFLHVHTAVKYLNVFTWALNKTFMFR